MPFKLQKSVTVLKISLQNKLLCIAILAFAVLPVAGGVESADANSGKASEANVSSESRTAILTRDSEPEHMESDSQANAAVTNGVGTKGDKPGIPFKTDSGITGVYLLKIFVSLVLVLGLAYLVVLYLRKINPGWFAGTIQHSRHINIIEQKRITPRLSIYLLDINSTKIILAQSGDNVCFYPTSVQIDSDISGGSVIDKNNVSE